MKETLWCCVGTKFKDSPFYDWGTLSYLRKDSIKKCVGTGALSWLKYKSKGWKCIKVTMQITPLTK